MLYYGGSVTDGVGASCGNETSWRGLFGKWLGTMFPDAGIRNLNMAMSGTGSKLGLYRLDTDVLPYKPDLIFIEFAINDFFLYEKFNEIMIQNETMVRKLLSSDPQADIVYLYTEAIYTASDSALHPGAAPQDEIACFYGLNALRIGKALTDTIPDKSSIESPGWQRYFHDSVHPRDSGYRFYFDVIKEFFVNEFELYNGGNVQNRILPDGFRYKIMNRYSFIRGEELKRSVSGGWKYSKETAESTSFVRYDGYMYTDSPGEVLFFTFKGKACSVFFDGRGVHTIENSVDGSDWKKNVSDGNRPLTLLFDEETSAEHTIGIRFNDSETEFDFKIIGLLVWYE